MSITQQKADMREIIHRRIEKYLAARPDRAVDVAMGAVRLLSKKMTLRELRDWVFTLHTDELLAEVKRDRNANKR